MLLSLWMVYLEYFGMVNKKFSWQVITRIGWHWLHLHQCQSKLTFLSIRMCLTINYPLERRRQLLPYWEGTGKTIFMGKCSRSLGCPWTSLSQHIGWLVRTILAHMPWTILIFIYVCVFVNVWHICAGAGAIIKQKRASDLELELQNSCMSPDVGTENQTLVFWKSSKHFLTTDWSR